jgi:hypothetical protein
MRCVLGKAGWIKAKCTAFGAKLIALKLNALRFGQSWFK